MERKSGVLMHISSLPGEYSVGSFGKEAKYFIDLLQECGFTYWQVLPFGVTDGYNSPYQSYSAFAGNPYFIDLETLFEKGYITADELALSRQSVPYVCEYERLKKERFDLLLKASHRLTDKVNVEEFIAQNPYLEKFCEFMALKSANGGRCWNEWKTDKLDQDILFCWKMIQYEFFSQWQEIKIYANKKGIRIMGDIPIYVSYDSSDVWSNPKLFLLDEKQKPSLVAGVPPDFFCTDGQLWNNPLYDWASMKKDGYKWWSDRVRHMSDMFDAIRIDHFRGLESYWAIPANAATAKEGSWRKGPGLNLISVIKKASLNTGIIAEDLGNITPEVSKLLKESGFAGMRVFQFGFMGENDSPHRPHNYPENCFAYTGTHDNNTLLGFLWEMDSNLRDSMLNYCNHTGDWKDGCSSVIRTMLASHAKTVIFPIQDLLGFGADTRLNVPGVASGNWQFRVTRNQLDNIDRNCFRNLNLLYSR